MRRAVPQHSRPCRTAGLDCSQTPNETPPLPIPQNLQALQRQVDLTRQLRAADRDEAADERLLLENMNEAALERAIEQQERHFNARIAQLEQKNEAEKARRPSPVAPRIAPAHPACVVATRSRRTG